MNGHSFPSLTALGDHFAEQSKRLRESAGETGKRKHGTTKAGRAFLRARANAFMDVAITIWNSRIEPASPAHIEEPRND